MDQSHGIDPTHVAMRWISVEENDGQRLIRYHVYRTTHTGRPLVDPDDPDRAWTEERTSPLQTGLPDRPSHCVMVEPARGGE